MTDTRRRFSLVSRALFLSALSLGACAKDKPAADKAPASAKVSGETPCGLGLEIAPSASVASIGSTAVPCSELAERVQGKAAALFAEYQGQLRRVHEQELVSLINDRILSEKAKAKGMSIEEFVASEVVVTEASEEELQGFYERAVAAGEELPPMEEIKEDLRAFVNEQKQRNAIVEYRTRLRQEAQVKTMLPSMMPPVVDVAAIGPSMGGPESAPVTIVEFSDFQCGYCRNAESVLRKVLKNYGDKVRLVYRDFPLEFHPLAIPAAEAALCAGKQDKYWDMHDEIFRKQAELSEEAIAGFAEALKLDMDAWKACMDSHETRETIVASADEGARAGVSGTPAFFINGRMITGSESYERFAEIIDHELAAAGVAK